MARAYITLAIGIGFLLGITLASFPAHRILIFILAGSVFVGGIYRVRGRATDKARIILLATIFLVALYGGYVYHRFRASFTVLSYIIPQNTHEDFRGILMSDPRTTLNATYADLDLLPPYRGSVLLVVPPETRFLFGDEVAGRTSRPVGSSIRGKPEIVFPEIEIRAHGRAPWLLQSLATVKNLGLTHLARHFTGDAATLMEGLLFGAPRSATPSFKELLARSGTSHLVALSGYNIVILVSAAAFIFRHFFSRVATVRATLGFIALFVIMVGGSPSIVRAALMGSIGLLAYALGRRYHFLTAVIVAATMMAAYDPHIIRDDIGFQLSFVSLLGLHYISQPLIDWLHALAPSNIMQGFFGACIENGLITLGAQLAVAPLLIFHFGSLSPVALATNILILLFIPLTMALGAITIVIDVVIPLATYPIALITRVLLGYHLAIIAWGSNIGGITVPMMLRGEGGAIVYYLFIALCMLLVHRGIPPHEHKLSPL